VFKVAFVRQRAELRNGQSIFDDKLCKSLLERSSTVEEFPITNGSLSNSEKERLGSFDIVILSHFETFKYKGFCKKVIFINHDIPYRAYLKRTNIVSLIKGFMFYLKSKYYLASPGKHYFISDEEFNLYAGNIDAGRLYVGVDMARVAPDPELYELGISITGNYKWSLKAKALSSALRLIKGMDIPILFSGECGIANTALIDSGIVFKEEAPEPKALCFGLISDDFTSGFKLKSLDLIANNCILITRSDIRQEFYGLPNNEYFVNYFETREDVIEIQKKIDALQDNLLPYFIEFKKSVISRFSWELSADLLLRDFA
jgi:hypothetical protein